MDFFLNRFDTKLAVGGSGGVRGIEGHVVSHCFKPLVTRFVEALKEIRENMVSRVITGNKTYYTYLFGIFRLFIAK